MTEDDDAINFLLKMIALAKKDTGNAHHGILMILVDIASKTYHKIAQQKEGITDFQLAYICSEMCIEVGKSTILQIASIHPAQTNSVH